MSAATRAGIAPVAGLFVLAPLVGEYLLGNVSIVELRALPILALLYGSGAILVREAARRTGGGWPAMIVLGLAYGLAEAALIDQTLFNPPGVEGATPEASFVPALGFSVANLTAFVGGHTIWSIGVPIALVEAMTPGRRSEPWLGRTGLVVTGGLYLLGAAIIFRFMYRGEQFLAPVPQLAGAAVAVLALLGLGLAIRSRPGRASARRAPRPWVAGVVSFLLSGLYFLKGETWSGVAYALAVAAVAVVVIWGWSRRAGWGPAHRFAVAAGALLTYAWGGFLLTTLLGRAGAIHLVGNAVFAAGAVALLLVARRRVRQETSAERDDGEVVEAGGVG